MSSWKSVESRSWDANPVAKCLYGRCKSCMGSKGWLHQRKIYYQQEEKRLRFSPTWFGRGNFMNLYPFRSYISLSSFTTSLAPLSNYCIKYLLIKLTFWAGGNTVASLINSGWRATCRGDEKWKFSSCLLRCSSRLTLTFRECLLFMAKGWAYTKKNYIN